MARIRPTVSGAAHLSVAALEDTGAIAAVAAHLRPVCLMHKQGNPDAMQQSPQYQDVVGEG